MELNNKTIIVTGGAGFIGSNLIRYLIGHTTAVIINVDKLTYAGNTGSLSDLQGNSRYFFEHRDIQDKPAMASIFQKYQPDAVMHLAAESHVDRSIDGPADFLNTNVMGTFVLLETSRAYYQSLSGIKKQEFRFLHVSTDEVFGSLEAKGLFTENTAYDPKSPYSASKAASDHLVRAWSNTYHFPALITNCSNNYGPYQYPEKLIPVVIQKALNGQPIPVYGKGVNIRDWLYVEDHARALATVLTRGETGQTYLIGGRNEKNNLEVVKTICAMLDRLVENPVVKPYAGLIEFVADRPGHDLRYAIDPSKTERELGWKAEVSFAEGMEKTVRWYLQNTVWIEKILNGETEIKRLGLAGSKK